MTTASPATTTTVPESQSPIAEPVAEEADPPAPEPQLLLPAMPVRYEAPASEPYAEAKTVAGRIAQQLLNYDPGATLDELAARVRQTSDQTSALAEALVPIYHEDHWSRATVVYPQIGGATDDRLSVMTVMDQQVGNAEMVTVSETRTLDIRLMKRNGAWVFESLASAGGIATPRPENLSAIATTVVDHPDIELPDSARWDIYRGTTTPELLALMAELADNAPYAVAVLTTGHPYHVFETDSVSNHSVGRAVDVYRFRGTRIVDSRDIGSAAWVTGAWLCAQAGLGSIGGPWTFDDEMCRSFTNDVHQDHVHISVSSSY